MGWWIFFYCQSNEIFATYVNEVSFLLGVIITVLFYIEYKKCDAETDKEEMLDQFLKD